MDKSIITEVIITWPWDDDTNVFLHGDFFGWDHEGRKICPTEKGCLEIRLQLGPGLYQYKFVVNGTWRHNPFEPTLTTPEGHVNNFIKIVSPFMEKAIVVLGEKLTEDGDPSPILKNRVTTMCNYVQNHSNEVSLVILTGGKVSGNNHPSEAQAMKDLAISLGYDERIPLILDEKAKNTYDNAMNARSLLGAHFLEKPYHVVLVTSDFHANRAEKIFSSIFAQKNVEITRHVSNSPRDILEARQKGEEYLIQQVDFQLSKLNL